MIDKVFIDSDIILDLLGQRKPFDKPAAELFTMADHEKIACTISSLCFSNVHYILAKQIGKEGARSILKKFKALVTVSSVDDKIIDLALTSQFKDFEDAIQYYTAIANNCSVLLTRNLKDYKEAQIPVMTAESYVKMKNSKLM